MKVLRIKELLKEKNITGKEFVQKIGITETSLSRIIKGDQQPRFELLVDIAQVLNVDIRELFYPTKESNIKENDLFILKDGKHVPIGKIDLSKLD